MQICKTEIHIYLYFVAINKPSKSDTFLMSDNKSLTSLWGFWFGFVLKRGASLFLISTVPIKQWSPSNGSLRSLIQSRKNPSLNLKGGRKGQK